MLIYEDFIRCLGCDNPDFKEEHILTFHPKIREREDKTVPLAHMDKQLIYVCTQCGRQLDR